MVNQKVCLKQRDSGSLCGLSFFYFSSKSIKSLLFTPHRSLFPSPLFLFFLCPFFLDFLFSILTLQFREFNSHRAHYLSLPLLRDVSVFRYGVQVLLSLSQPCSLTHIVREIMGAQHSCTCLKNEA